MKKLHLTLGVITFFLLGAEVRYMTKPPFGFIDVQKIAELRSKTPYQPAQEDLPEPLQGFNYDQNRDIRWKDELTLWKNEQLPFQIKFFQRTGWQPDRMDVFEISKKNPQRLVYDSRQFDFGKNKLAVLPSSDLGYAGFRVHYPINRKDYLDEVIVFLGASYFRAVGQNQQHGISARGVAVNCGIERVTEEFPRFTHFWLKRPERTATSLRMFALLEGPSVTGAYEFLIAPGAETQVDVKFVLYVRKKIRRLGLAPLTSMYWFGENHRLNIQDVRPEVHDSDGLQIHTSTDEWIWHPLSNEKHQRDNFFLDKGISSFGLMQRDRNFINYEDLESHYEKRPSVWIEPKKAMEDGQVVLVQLPTDKETDDNIVSYWWSGQPTEAGSVIEGSYKMLWAGDNAGRPPLAASNQTLIQYPVKNEPIVFTIDFQGAELEKRSQEHPPEVELLVSQKIEPKNIRLVPNAPIKGWRVIFEIPSDHSHESPPLEIKCRLKSGDKALTETWSYTWSPRR